MIAVSDATGQVLREHVYLGGLPIALIDYSTGVEVAYAVHTDHLGTPRVMTDAAGTEVWRISAKPFGETVAITGTASNDNRFPGQVFDAESGLHYNYFRDYDPSLGRYLQSDPIGLRGGLNTYAYVGGNPVLNIDILGLWSTEAHNYFVDQYFPDLSPQDKNAIKRGSRSADSPVFQFGDSSHMHAMGNGEDSDEELCAKMSDFIAERYGRYKNLINAISNASNGRIKKALRSRAYYELGMALHAAMDSTSPAHSGWQTWQWDMETVGRHGDFPHSLENLKAAQNPDNLARTLAAMDQVMSEGNLDCLCQ